LNLLPMIERTWFFEELVKRKRIRRLTVGIVDWVGFPGKLKVMIEDSDFIVEELEVFSIKGQFFKECFERTFRDNTWFQPELTLEWWGIDDNSAVVTTFSEKKPKDMRVTEIETSDTVEVGTDGV
jgi:hypothetical protein